MLSVRCRQGSDEAMAPHERREVTHVIRIAEAFTWPATAILPGPRPPAHRRIDVPLNERGEEHAR